MLEDELAAELRNFEEIARFLNPSPGQIPRLEGVDIHGLCLPLRRRIGGDHLLYVDFNERFDLDKRIQDATRAGREQVAAALRANRERAGILVADVSGHQMTDALIAAMLHQSFLLGAHYELEIFGEITTRLFELINERFHRTSGINKYLTMIYGEISARGRFRFISAGHPPPLVFSREYGRFMPLGESRTISSIPVGMLPSGGDPDQRLHPSVFGRKQLYEVNEIDLLADGDILLLHTDGFSDHGAEGWFPEVPRRVLAEHKAQSAAAISERLRESLLEQAPPQDDITLVVIKYTPPSR